MRANVDGAKGKSLLPKVPFSSLDSLEQGKVRTGNESEIPKHNKD